MSDVQRQSVSATTNGSGDATVYSDYRSGKLHMIRYVKTDYDDGVDFTITVDGTGEAILAGTNVNATQTFYPRVPVCGPTGSGLTYDGTRTVNEPVAINFDRVKIVVAQGGNTKTGTFHLVFI